MPLSWLLHVVNPFLLKYRVSFVGNTSVTMRTYARPGVVALDPGHDVGMPTTPVVESRALPRARDERFRILLFPL